ncbi:MAG: hypothetical protein O3A01_00265 [bacterium]|nr:hypothetical protein [bacterium]
MDGDHRKTLNIIRNPLPRHDHAQFYPIYTWYTCPTAPQDCVLSQESEQEQSALRRADFNGQKFYRTGIYLVISVPAYASASANSVGNIDEYKGDISEQPRQIICDEVLLARHIESPNVIYFAYYNPYFQNILTQRHPIPTLDYIQANKETWNTPFRELPTETQALSLLADSVNNHIVSLNFKHLAVRTDESSRLTTYVRDSLRFDVPNSGLYNVRPIPPETEPPPAEETKPSPTHPSHQHNYRYAVKKWEAFKAQERRMALLRQAPQTCV